MITITIHLNHDEDAFSGLTPSKAVLEDAGTYVLPATQYIPSLLSLGPVLGSEEAKANQDLYVKDILNFVYEQLHDGGDIVPAEAFTTAYRAAGHRSLSVGDLVTFGDDETTFGYHDTWAVELFGFKKVLAAGMIIRRGEFRYEFRNELPSVSV